MGHIPTRSSKALTEEDAAKLLKYLVANSNPLNWLFEILLRTGCRQNELLEIDSDGLDASRKAIHIVSSKGSVARWLPVSSECLDRGRLMVIGGDLGLDGTFCRQLWPESSDDSIMRYLRAHFTWLQHTVFGEAKYCLHGIRHTYAMIMYRQFRGDIRKLQLAMGHKSIANTAKYLASIELSKSADGMREAFRELESGEWQTDGDEAKKTG